MPIYEFRCAGCRRRTSVFTRTMAAPEAVACENCGSREVSRLFSRVAVVRSGDDEYGGFDEASLGGVDENDPRAVAKWVRKMSREMGEPMDPQMESELERMEAGEMPEDDFGGNDGLDGDFAGVE